MKYDYKEINYTPDKFGAVVALRVFTVSCSPYAELAFAFGGTVTIPFDDCNIRKPYLAGINSYTVLFDERTENKTFADFIVK